MAFPLLLFGAGIAAGGMGSYLSYKGAEKAGKQYTKDMEKAKSQAITEIQSQPISIIKNWLQYIYPRMASQVSTYIDEIDATIDEPRLKASAILHLSQDVLPQVSQQGLGQAILTEEEAKRQRSSQISGIMAGFDQAIAEGKFGVDMSKAQIMGNFFAGIQSLVGAGINYQAQVNKVPEVGATPSVQPSSFGIGSSNLLGGGSWNSKIEEGFTINPYSNYNMPIDLQPRW
ncbi:MAG: hypothetical protein H8D45_24265 [Bacteroidetes bacterium]|nr:hypothetical protein [Bacteroidota bacterium]